MSLISIGLLGVIYSYWVYDDNIITYGNLSLAVGIFGTLIGLYDAFAAIENMGSVSQGILSLCRLPCQEQWPSSSRKHH